MITTKQITVREILCDKCGAPVIYSGQYCIVCGKHFCQRCDGLRFLDFDGPKYFRLTDYAPDVPRCRACVGCENEITKGMRKLKLRVDFWNTDREYHAELYNKLAGRISRLIEQRETEIENQNKI
jgi:hypothetical protein